MNDFKKFPWQAKNEIVLLFTREHIIHFIRRNIPNIFIIILISIVFSIITYFLINNILVNFFIGIIILLIWISIILFFWYNTYLIITNKRIIKFVKNWLFSEHIKELKLDQLNELSTSKKGLLSKILNFWNIKIVWKDKENAIWFQWVKYPDEIILYISRLRDFLRENPDFPINKIKPFIPRKLRKKQF